VADYLLKVHSPTWLVQNVYKIWRVTQETKAKKEGPIEREEIIKRKI
jgi:hypothetical protein